MLERFDDYVERCLYDPRSGFYAAGVGSAGRRRGDFVTSPEVGPLFAEVVARALDHWWEERGRPEVLPVFDVGTGPGTLARGLAEADGPSAAARRVEGIDRGQHLPDDLSGAIVVANELLDNLPFRVLERTTDGWDEVWVATDDDGGPAEVLRPLDDPPATVGALTGLDELAVGVRIPVLDRARGWLHDVLGRGPAVVLVIDYGGAATAELARRGGWLRTYRAHERGDDPYRDPGRWDITTDVAVDQLPAPDELLDQATFLRRFGIEALVDEGRRQWEANAAAPDLAAIRMRSRTPEAAALLDPSGLGSWLVGLWVGP